MAAEKKVEKIVVKVTPAMRAELERIRKADDPGFPKLTLSEVCRGFLDEGIRRRKSKEKKK